MVFLLWIELEAVETFLNIDMAPRLNIDQITTDTVDWTSKVQIIDISRKRQSPEKKIRFQNLIFEDEEEGQIRAVLYEDDIEHYADKLILLQTYLISAARVKVSPTGYGKILHQFYWVLDKETTVEHVQLTDEVEKPLPPPTKLNITTFDRIAHCGASEIDILGIVIRCGPLKYAGHTKKQCREITIADNQKNQVMVTLWEDFGEIEGSELQVQIENAQEFPVILGRSIGVSHYQGFSLQTRYNSTIRINPTYPQALELITWAKTNKSLLSNQVPEGCSVSLTPVIVPPADDQIISIAEITSETSVGVFYVEAEMVISNDLQQFCVLECPGCKQRKRTKDHKLFDCPRCQRRTTLVPRCTFQIDLVDGSGSITAFISGSLAEKLLSMTAENIFETTCVKHQLLPINHVQQVLSNKLFRVQLKKSSWISSNVTHTTVTFLSYTELEYLPLPNLEKRDAKKVKALAETVKVTDTDIECQYSNKGLLVELVNPTAEKNKSLGKKKVQMKDTTAEFESSNVVAASIEPPTPTKKL